MNKRSAAIPNRTITAAPKLSTLAASLLLAGMATAPFAAYADKSSPRCPAETVFYDPGQGQDVVLPEGYKIEVFAKDLNFPADIEFVGDRHNFRAIVLESGTGLPSACTNNALEPGGVTSPSNPFTPGVLIFDQRGTKLAGPLGKPTSADLAKNTGFQADGPAIGLAFEHGLQGGTLFGTDSAQGIRGARGAANNTSRVVSIDLNSGHVTPVIRGLPTGDHPSEQIVVKGGWLYWSQGSVSNAGVTGHDNGSDGKQHEIACQQITLSNNVWDSGDGHKTSGYSNHGVQRPGVTVPAYEGATSKGMCTGAILRANINDPQNTIEPVAWGFRNPFGLRFSPRSHPLKGQLMISENGEDERGARPVANAPDRLAVARQNPDGTPEYHGWPDRFGFLDSTQAVFNPKGGPADDLFPDVARIKADNTPVRHVLAFPPQPPVAPLAIGPADSSPVGLDFAPRSFVYGTVKRHAVLIAREGDFGFAAENGDPSEGHDVQLVNWTKTGNPNELQLSRFAFNCPSRNQGHNPDGSPTCSVEAEQAFAARLHGINRPITLRFGPDGAAYVVDYGAVRDLGLSNPATRFVLAADAPLVQIPGTGVIWKITCVSPKCGARGDDDHDD